MAVMCVEAVLAEGKVAGISCIANGFDCADGGFFVFARNNWCIIPFLLLKIIIFAAKLESWQLLATSHYWVSSGFDLQGRR